MNRHLEWEGCFNVRDLGGLVTGSGATIRRGAFVRGDDVSRLTGAGWSELESHGIRTVVDLRNEDELEPGVAPRPETLASVRVPIDDLQDEVFWEEVRRERLDGSPLYFRPFIERKAERCAAALIAIAEAEPGGVLFHCGRGRDRTGLVALLLLSLLGVAPGDIASDYDLSAERLRPLDASRGEPDQGIEIARILEAKGTSSRKLIFDLLGSVNLPEVLGAGGLRDEHVSALKARGLERDPSGQ